MCGCDSVKCFLRRKLITDAARSQTKFDKGQTPLRRRRYYTAPLVEKPGDMMYNERSYWTDEKIQRTSHDAYFSVV
jgi:hypothetical protein